MDLLTQQKSGTEREDLGTLCSVILSDFRQFSEAGVWAFLGSHFQQKQAVCLSNTSLFGGGFEFVSRQSHGSEEDLESPVTIYSENACFGLLYPGNQLPHRETKENLSPALFHSSNRKI